MSPQRTRSAQRILREIKERNSVSAFIRSCIVLPFVFLWVLISALMGFVYPEFTKVLFAYAFMNMVKEDAK